MSTIIIGIICYSSVASGVIAGEMEIMNHSDGILCNSMVAVDELFNVRLKCKRMLCVVHNPLLMPNAHIHIVTESTTKILHSIRSFVAK